MWHVFLLLTDASRIIWIQMSIWISCRHFTGFSLVLHHFDFAVRDPQHLSQVDPAAPFDVPKLGETFGKVTLRTHWSSELQKKDNTNDHGLLGATKWFPHVKISNNPMRFRVIWGKLGGDSFEVAARSPKWMVGMTCLLGIRLGVRFGTTSTVVVGIQQQNSCPWRIRMWMVDWC